MRSVFMACVFSVKRFRRREYCLRPGLCRPQPCGRITRPVRTAPPTPPGRGPPGRCGGTAPLRPRAVRCSSQPGAVRPSAFTTRWQGTPCGAGPAPGPRGGRIRASRPAGRSVRRWPHARRGSAPWRPTLRRRIRRGSFIARRQSSLSFRRSAFSATIRWSIQSWMSPSMKAARL